MLAYLHRAMVLGTKEDPTLVLRIPGWFEKLPEDNVRTGVLSPEMYRALLAELAPHARLALVIGYHLGMRRGVATAHVPIPNTSAKPDCDCFKSPMPARVFNGRA
jgi:hypothetical protein